MTQETLYQRTSIQCSLGIALSLGLLLPGGAALAGSAAWFTPNSVNWNQANNWTPTTVPNGAADTATFYSTNITAISLSSNTEVNRIVFTSDAAFSPYTITTPPAVAFTISGVGITNNSAVTQNFVTAVSGAFAGLTRFTNSASAGADTHTVFTSNGGGTSGFGGGTTQFKDTSTAGFAVFNANAGAVNGALGGIIEFRDNATGGNGKFTVKGGAITNAVGGTVQFFDSATAGSGAFTTNGSSVVNGNGALTQFFNSSTGGLATFINNGGTAFDASGGITQFLDTSTAGNGIFTNNGNTTSDFFGLTRFRNSATAGTATFNNNGGGLTYFSDNSAAGSGTFNSNGGTASNANAGATEFFGTSTAGNATFNANGGTVSGANGGLTYFADSSTAGNGTFTAYAGAVSGANIGMTQFSNSSSAGSATLINQPSSFNSINGDPGGLTQFNQTSTAGTANILNVRTAVDGAYAGNTVFLESSTAGSSTITNQGGIGGQYERGYTDFRGNSTAGTAVINNLPATAAQGGGGFVRFYDHANAGSATIINAGGVINTYYDLNSSAAAFFTDASTAGDATITNQGASSSGGAPGYTRFYKASAGNATIINEASDAGGAGGYTEFDTDVSNGNAGSATIINRGSTAAFTYGGKTTFSGTSAGTSTITAEGSSTGFGSSVVFGNNATAADSTITALGATGVNGFGGSVTFDYATTAGNATLVAESPAVPGARGGRITFWYNADGGTARAIVGSGATLDISYLTSAGMSIGSIEGDGTFFLGSRSLDVGGNGADRIVSGVISDGGGIAGIGGSLIKSGTGTLTLSGANTYTGATTVNSGTLAVNGSILGDVTVNDGATLAGIGTVGGLVTVASGGTLSPGDSPGTLTMGALTLNSGAATTIELAGTAAGAEYDQLHVGGPLSLDGALHVVLTAFSPAAGDSFDILDWATLSGTFSTLDLPSVKGGLTWNTDRLYVDGSLAVGGVVGDYNHNGVVDAADYIVWRVALGSTTNLDADGNGNHLIDAGDFDAWRAHFGQTAGGSGSGATAGLPRSAAVPEPGTFQLLLLTVACVLLRAVPWVRSRSNETGRHADGQTRRIVSKRLSLSPCLLVSSCFMIIAATQAQRTHAQTYWTATTGDWNSSVNWSAGLPNSLSPAFINNGGTARVLTAGTVAEHATLGDGATDIGSLEITGGSLDLPQPRAGTMKVGNFGSGTLTVNSGGKLTTRFSYLGVQPNSAGSATVTGSNSSWSASEALYVGLYGYGWLAIQSAAAVSYTYAATPAYLGYAATGSGTIVVDGTNSNFTSSADLFVGNSGIGWMYLLNGGKATNVNGDLAVNSGSFGTVSVDGTGSTWTNNSVVAVGVSGTAELSVSGGGAVTSTNGRIGREVGSNGTTTVIGAGSNWTASGDMSIGNAGTGSLSVLDGAKVTNVNGNLGVLAGSLGVVTVSGPGSWWKNNSVVAVGVSGAGQLKVLNRALVTSTNGRIGRELNSSGDVTVDGFQSYWDCTGALTIGLGGTGTGNLKVTNGGLVSASGGMTIGPLGMVTGDATIYADVINGGLVSPGNSLGALSVSGSYAQTTGGTLQLELASSTDYDKLQINGGITFGGTLEVGLVGGYIPRGGSYSFDILDWTGAHAGAFSNIYLPTADGTLTWDLSQLYTSGVISVIGTGSPDDFNGDGVVDAGDFVMWRKGLGVNFSQADYDVWRANFAAGPGSSATRSASAPAAVPEPASLVLLLFAMAGWCRRWARPA